MYEYDGTQQVLLSEYEAKEARLFDDPIAITGDKGEVTTLFVDEMGLAKIYIKLSWNLHKMFNEGVLGSLSEDGALELYFSCSYNEDKNIYLPVQFGDYLLVKRSKQRLFLQSATRGYPFPEIRSANGDIIVFSDTVISSEEDKENKLIDYAKDKIKDYTIDKVSDGIDNTRRAIAIHQLRQGKLVTNIGSTHWRKNIYTYTDFTNTGEQVSIQRASHMGWRKGRKLVTTKGISQLDYFENIGVYNNIAKVAKELLLVFDFIDLAKYMSGNGKPSSPLSSIPAIGFLAELLSEMPLRQIREWKDDITKYLLETAKDLGVAGVKDFVQTRGNLDEEGNKTYNVIAISQYVYNELMKGNIKTLIDIEFYRFEEENKKRKEYYSGKHISMAPSEDYLLLYKRQPDELISDDIFLITTIFINQE